MGGYLNPFFVIAFLCLTTLYALILPSQVQLWRFCRGLGIKYPWRRRCRVTLDSPPVSLSDVARWAFEQAHAVVWREFTLSLARRVDWFNSLFGLFKGNFSDPQYEIETYNIKIIDNKNLLILTKSQIYSVKLERNINSHYVEINCFPTNYRIIHSILPYGLFMFFCAWMGDMFAKILFLLFICFQFIEPLCLPSLIAYFISLRCQNVARLSWK